MALSFLGGALVLGKLGHEASQKMARSEFEATHVPSLKAWHHALGSRGFQRIQHPTLMNRILRTLPFLSETRRTVWLDSSRRWVILYSGDRAQPIPAVFGPFNAASPPSGMKASKHSVRLSKELRGELPDSWETHLVVWDVFDKVLELVDQAHPDGVKLQEILKKPQKKRRVSTRDPREIRY